MKVICHHCSPKGFCETCTTRIPEDGKKNLSRTFTQRNVLVGTIWLFIVLGFASLAMYLVAGGESFQTNYPFAGTLQTVFMAIGLVVFFGFFLIAILSVRMVRKTEATMSNVANITRLDAHQTRMPIQNVGIITDHVLLQFRAEVEGSLRIGPKQGINEIVRTLVGQNITPENHIFLETVRGQVATLFRKTNDVGQAIVSFLIITKIMELSSLIQNNPNATLNGLPGITREFLLSVTQLQNASNATKKVLYGR
ncbi:MAG: hypothetical protein ACTSSK_02485 [Candidatus Heimdallarchaeota archaeon]